jgi:UbiD family decarboxylase
MSAMRVMRELPTGTASAFDLRAWLEKVKAIEQLREVANADLHLELGAISELNAKRHGPALLFGNFSGYPPGFRVLTGAMLNARTLGLTMGISENLETMAFTDRIADKLKANEANPLAYPLEFVNDGPVMENQATHENVDLNIFPAPLWHEMDGGPYIGTGCVHIYKDRDTDWINVGTYRVQRHSRNTVGTFISPGHHGDMIRQKYWEKNEPCPVVIVLGSHPLFLVMGGLEVPFGVGELNWIGAVAEQRVPVLRGPLTGLPIPAGAEIAIEGFVSRGDDHDEGPFGEFTGYYAGGKHPTPLVRVQAVYYRNDPILLGAPPSRPLHDYSYFSSVMRSAAIKQELRKAGVPGVKGVWVSEAGASRMWVITSIQQQYAGHALQAANIAVQCQAGALMNRYSIVVDEDIDPSNGDDVIWAISTRSDPATDINILRQCWSNPLDPMIATEEKEKKRLWNSRAIINACRPWDRLQAGDFPPVAEATPALLQATRKKWAWLFENALSG